MKCAKCGYISFDHLSECRKCQASMTAVREALGFCAAKPAVPSLLASLLSDSLPQAPHKEPVKGPAPKDAFSLQMEMGSALNEGFGGQPAYAAVADAGDAEEDFSLLDLSDEELERLIDHTSPESPRLEPWDKEHPAFSPMQTGDASTDSPLRAGDASPRISMADEADISLEDDFTINLDDFDEEIRDDGLESSADSRPTPQWENDPPLTLEFEHEPKDSARPSETSGDDFVIDLSESDLDALLKRLENESE